MPDRVEVKGLRKVQERLRALGSEAARKAMRAGLEAGIAVMAREVEARTPEHTGALKASIVTAVDVSSDGTHGSARVGFGRQGYIARWVEFGHREMSHGGRKERRQIGTVPPHPFLRPAFLASYQAAREAAVEAIRRRLG